MRTCPSLASGMALPFALDCPLYSLTRTLQSLPSDSFGAHKLFYKTHLTLGTSLVSVAF